MQTAKIFKNGRSQAIRLPKEFRFEGTEVYISKVGQKVILSAKPGSWKDFFFSNSRPTPDFMEEREQLDLEERNIFK
ncbi:MAG: antitoxin [Deltaproteobacteria bacterium]|nr:antitoxin [Deltaproteobacteria bacterium]